MSASSDAAGAGACTLRPLAPAEVATLIDWAADEGWNPGLDDADAFHAADPGGFIGAFVDDRLVAGISAVAYDAAFGFIGLYLCRHDRRGRGYGKAVWDAGIARLGDRTIGLDGVDAQRDNYVRKGFAPAYRTVRYSGRPRPPVAAGGLGGPRAAPASDDEAIVPVDAAIVAAILAFDRSGFPAPRAAFVERWTSAPRVALAWRRSDAVAGYGVLRACRSGWKVGPLFAADTNGAIALLAALSARAGPAGEIHLDVPQPNEAFVRYLTGAGFVPGFETTRMYRGPRPAVGAATVFAVTTLELG